MPTPDEIQNLSYLKSKKLEAIIDEIEQRIKNSSSKLTRSFYKLFLEKLNVQNGRIMEKLNTQIVNLFNKAYGSYTNTARLELLQNILSDIDIVVGENTDFYKQSTNPTQKDIDDIKKIIYRRLGMDDEGKILKKGYLSSLSDESGIRSEIQKHIFKKIFKGTTPEALRTSLKFLIEGDDKRLGIYEKHYRTFSFDVYAQLDAYTGALYAEKLNLRYFIYNGGIIETSRAFCKKRNGKIFSIDEAETWKEDPTLTAIPDRESHNWLIDRGGYNCRHTIDFIAEEVAMALRPDLKDAEPSNTIEDVIEPLL